MNEFKLRSAEAQGPQVEDVNISLKTLFLVIETIISKEAEISKLVADILVTPLDLAVIFPSLLIDAIASLDDSQVTDNLSSLFPSLSNPRA